MKRYITQDRDTVDVVNISELITTPEGKKLYGKFMNCSTESALAYLQGVVDTAQIFNLDVPGLSSLWNDVCEYGVDVVRKALVI